MTSVNCIRIIPLKVERAKFRILLNSSDENGIVGEKDFPLLSSQILG